MPYIKPLFEMIDTIDKNYLFLKVLIKEEVNKKDGVMIIYALFTEIMKEFGLDWDKIMKEENYSIIDYFVNNHILIGRNFIF